MQSNCKKNKSYLIDSYLQIVDGIVMSLVPNFRLKRFYYIETSHFKLQF